MGIFKKTSNSFEIDTKIKNQKKIDANGYNSINI
jgi:hypothetical protein